jgi:hypothetical protein
MSIRHGWNPEETIYLIEVDERWKWAEFLAGVTEAYALIEASNQDFPHNFDIIFWFRTNAPSGHAPFYIRRMHELQPANIDRTIIISKDEYLKAVVRIIAVTRRWHRLILFATLVEALNLISVMNAELE